MSTRAAIIIKDSKSKYNVYHHCDGYPEYNGVILYYHYSDPMKIKLLMSLGDISYLGENVLPDTTKTHTFDERQDDVTVAYHRDRGEDLHFNVFTDKDDSSISDVSFFSTHKLALSLRLFLINQSRKSCAIIPYLFKFLLSSL